MKTWMLLLTVGCYLWTAGEFAWRKEWGDAGMFFFWALGNACVILRVINQ